MLTCFSSPAYFWGYLHVYYTGPYTAFCSNPCGNCHHKWASLTTSGQPIYIPKFNGNNQLNMFTQTWTVISNYLSIWEWCTEIKSNIHGPLQIIQTLKANHTSIQYKNSKNTNTVPITHMVIQFHNTKLVRLRK